jgi:hypothetical protein
LKGRRVRFTATAQRHVAQERTWWLENRDYRDLFATELEAATQILAVLPGAGTPYAHALVSGVRRLYLLAPSGERVDRWCYKNVEYS